MLIFLCIAGFFASFVDAIVGGGGLISIPALLATGMPTHLALGTNKLASTFGALSSAYHYYKSGTVRMKVVLCLIPFSFIGAVIGAQAVLAINADSLKFMIIILVAIIGFYTLFKKELGLIDTFEGMTRKTLIQGMVFALIIGFYTGFFGPGTGSFLIFGLIHIFGFDFKHGTANAKFLNLTSNLTALVIFIFNAQVMFSIGIPMAIFMMLGAKAGSMVAVKKGSTFIKPVFVVVSFLLVAKMTIDLIGNGI